MMMSLPPAPLGNVGFARALKVIVRAGKQIRGPKIQLLISIRKGKARGLSVGQAGQWEGPGRSLAGPGMGQMFSTIRDFLDLPLADS